jgi:hypothetical protein
MNEPIRMLFTQLVEVLMLDARHCSEDCEGYSWQWVKGGLCFHFPLRNGSGRRLRLTRRHPVTQEPAYRRCKACIDQCRPHP